MKKESGRRNSARFSRREFNLSLVTSATVLAVPGLLQGCDEGNPEPDPQVMSNPANESIESSTTLEGSGQDVDEPEHRTLEEGKPADLDERKMTKAAANFQHYPNGEEQCGKCRHFLSAANKCRLVQGEIYADNWCRLFTPPAEV